MKSYKDKILDNKNLLKTIGRFPRKKGNEVAMCHGVFDLVHPGHIRHLEFAKSKTDILIVSITSDFHIKKSTHRPMCLSSSEQKILQLWNLLIT